MDATVASLGAAENLSEVCGADVVFGASVPLKALSVLEKTHVVVSKIVHPGAELCGGIVAFRRAPGGLFGGDAALPSQTTVLYTHDCTATIVVVHEIAFVFITHDKDVEGEEQKDSAISEVCIRVQDLIARKMPTLLYIEQGKFTSLPKTATLLLHHNHTLRLTPSNTGAVATRMLATAPTSQPYVYAFTLLDQNT